MEQGEIAEREWVGKPVPFTGYEGIAEISPSWYNVQVKPRPATETMPRMQREATNDAASRATLQVRVPRPLVYSVCKGATTAHFRWRSVHYKGKTIAKLREKNVQNSSIFEHFGDFFPPGGT